MRLFISYRRSDSQDVTGRLYDSLARRYPGDVFKDTSGIPIGADFRVEVSTAIERADIVLVVIGPGWLSAAGPDGRRLYDPDDPVRVEVEAALARGKRVVPVLVSNAQAPPPDLLPESIVQLAYLNAIPVRPDPDYARDVGRLAARLGEVVPAATEPAVPPTRLVEYLYVDRRRLDSYCEQIPAPARAPAGDHGRLVRLCRHLSATGQLVQLQPGLGASDAIWSGSLQGRPAPFHWVECSATKVFIPGREGDPFLPGVTLWFGQSAEMSEDGFRFYFIQDSQNADSDPKHEAIPTGFTRFKMLQSMLGQEKELLEAAGVGSATLRQVFSPDGWGNQFTIRGAVPPRRIRTVYRVRHCATSCGLPGLGLVYGYPLFIADASGGDPCDAGG